MTTEVPPPAGPPDEPEPAPLPSWVPVLIGVMLVLLGALAVFTGLRYRNNTLTSIVRPRKAPAAQSNAPAPPGEPQPGASLMFPGEAGDTTPSAQPAVSGKSRAVISGGGSAIQSTVRIWARRGMTTSVTPPDALVYVNDVAVGQASQLATTPYEFPQPGSYNVRITAPGYTDRSFVVTAADSAKEEIARIEVKLSR